MIKKKILSRQEADLRRRAEETARKRIARMPENLDTQTPEETSRLLHELLVHQIELEMQNEELRLAQAELNATRDRHFDLYDLAPVGYCTLSEKGLILEANLTAATLLGVGRGALIKQPLTRFILPEDQDIYYRHYKQLFETGEPQACELRMLKKHGAPFWAHLEATAAQDLSTSSGQAHDGTPVFRIVMSDNPERKRMVEALQESELNIRNMAEQLVDVLFATDDSGFITFVSPSALQMFGWKPEEMVGRNFIEFLTESEIPGAVAQFKDALTYERKMQNLSFVMRRKDESTFPGEVNSSVIRKDGRTTGTVGMIRDITGRLRAAEALKESEERYRNQVEAINDVAYSINSGGELTYISPVVRNLLGYEPDEITGRNFLEFVNQEDHDFLTRKFSELREGVVSHDEYRVICKSGDIKWVRSQTSPILDIGGFAGGRGVIIDMTERKRAEEALRVSEENFRRSLDESPLGVRIVTIEGETLYANRAILDIYGYDSIEELKATPVNKRYTPESYADFLIRKEKRQQGMNVPSEYAVSIIRKSGEVRHLQVFRKEILWDCERQFQTIYNDVTERKRSEDLLKQRTHELGERVKELNCLYGLSELFEKNSAESSDILMQDVVELLQSAWQFPRIACARITLDGQMFSTANFAQTPWQQQHAIRVHGTQIGSVEVCYLETPPDSAEGPFLQQEERLLKVVAERLGRVVERTQARQALHKSEERYRHAINATKDGLWEWNIQTNQEFFSPRWCEIIGYSFDDPELPHTYDSWASRIHPDYYDRVMKAMKSHLENGAEYNVDYRHRHKSGEYHWQNSRGQAVFNESGKPIKMVGCISDITEQKWTEQVLRQQREELSHVSRVSTVGEFAASIAHEIHQPLTAILNNAQAAQRFLSLDTPAIDEVSDAIQDIINDDRRAAEVIRHLRMFLKKDEADRTILDINSIIGEVLTILHEEIIDKSVYVTPDLSPDLPCVEGGRIELQQVLMNLILNGCDAMMNVDIQRRQMSIVTSVDEPNNILIAVRDSGTGLDKSAIERVFESYYTTKREGLGMGLSVSKTIIATHGGRIWAANNPEGGATFSFTLPIHKGKTL